MPRQSKLLSTPVTLFPVSGSVMHSLLKGTKVSFLIQSPGMRPSGKILVALRISKSNLCSHDLGKAYMLEFKFNDTVSL